jgi:hypothetical protein
LAQEGRAGRAGDRSGRLYDPAAIEDVVPGQPSKAWTGMFPERLWEASVSRLGHLMLLEPPLHRRVGNAAYALQVTAYGDSHAALTREIHDEALLHGIPERIDSRQQRLAVHAVHLGGATCA